MLPECQFKLTCNDLDQLQISVIGKPFLAFLQYLLKALALPTILINTTRSPHPGLLASF
jgi:hypothetical protein